MRPVTSITLALLFVFLAGFNVWNMLSPRGGGSALRARVWIQLHRIAGYMFILLFAVFTYFMALRIRGLSDELPPRLVLHVSLALLLAPLIFVKVIVARYQKANRGLLGALGIGIFALSFTLVALNTGVHFLRVAARTKIPITTSVPLGFIVLCLIAIGLVPRRTRATRAAASALSPVVPADLRSAGAPLLLTLARVERQTQDAKTLRFLLPQGKHLSFCPGQFLTFEWTIEGKSLSRCYSICSSPSQSAYIEITPKRVSNGCVSKFLNDTAQPGLTVRAHGPYGQFFLDEHKHQRIVLVAAGSGITPMIAMLRYIDDLCLNLPATLIYCVRTEEDVLFKNELAALQLRHDKFRYALVLSQPTPDWNGWKGRLRREILEREVERPLESTFFLCGPPAFMDLARSLLSALSVDDSNILQESFGGAVTSVRTPFGSGGPLRVTYARSGVTCQISPEKTLLESSEANGILMPFGCRQGSCGTCRSRLISGKVQMEHADALNDELRAEGFILPCVSRPLEDVILDA